MKNSDLHVHSYYSDGDLPPSQVVKLAKQKGIKNLALTDHNSFDGVLEAIKEGKKQGVNVIPAIEIRAKEDEVLGYFIDYKNEKFRREMKKIQNNLIKRVKKIIIKLNKKGIDVSFEDLLKKYYPNTTNLMEIHLIKYLKFKGYGDIRELWPRYISKGGETYVPIKEISVIDSIKLVKKFGGIPILAHPWVNPSSRELLHEKNFKKLIKSGLRGIEVDNGDRDERRDKKTLDKIQKLAKRYGLILTSGSDFHGDYLVKATKCHDIGDYNCDEKVVEQLKELRGLR
ncbi:MAG: PHP domain-containing protein [Nanoarchaeota archaeon]|nr:PHP domain-containing protein [Nanoarchaeota archaeon]